MPQRRVTRSVLLITALGITTATCWLVAQPPPDRKPVLTPPAPAQVEDLRPVPDVPRPLDIRESPPVVTRAGLQLLRKATARGNALLVVEIDRRTLRQDQIVLQDGAVRTVLRDDGKEGDERAGDGFFSGVLKVNLQEIVREQARLLDLARRRVNIPVFRGRELVSTVRIEPVLGPQAAPERPSTLPPLRPGRGAQTFKIPVFEAPAIRPGKLIPLPDIPTVDPATIDPTRTLLIHDPKVVEDPTRTFNPCTNTGNPNGKWTFGHLMTQLSKTTPANPLITPQSFTRRWLKRWEVDQVVNDFTVPNRKTGIQSQIINPWLARSSGPNLDLTKAPFRLLAIVNRVDLRQNLTYGGGSAGEARFVYGAVDLSNNCQPLPFTVIFEYGIRKKGCSDLKAWGQQWLDLQNHSLGSPAYNAALEAITLQFTEAGTNPLQTPNQSSLNQLRTNEIVLEAPWDLREFRLSSEDSDAGHLRQTTVKQTPDDTLNRTAGITAYVNGPDKNAILAGTNVVPLEFPLGTAFLGGNSRVPIPGFFWDGSPAGSITTPNLRHTFSLNTCNGCHGGETDTFFTHVSPGDRSLSAFLTGGPVNDPVDGTVRSFNDLLRRQQDLAKLLSQSCLHHIFFEPVNMVH